MTKWQDAVDQMIKESGVTVRRWRNTLSGRAFCGSDDWGVEIPVPKGPVSFAIAAHEIGHQLKHRKGQRPRWVEEVEAWEYALEQLARFELPGYNKVLRRATNSIDHAFHKAMRRGVALEKIAAQCPVWVERVWHKILYEAYKEDDASGKEKNAPDRSP